MGTFLVCRLAASAGWVSKTFGYEIVAGNAVWRFGLILLVMFAAMGLGRVVQYALNNYTKRRDKKHGEVVSTLVLKCLSKPFYVGFFAFGFYASKLCLAFDDPASEDVVEGLNAAVATGWTQIAKAVAAVAIAYAIFRLVDIAEFYLIRWTAKTRTKLDDMLVPVVRKSLRVTVAILAAIYIVDNVLNQDVKSILLGAGVGGIAIALAAKETIANFFGSITIFADRPFQIDEMIKVNDHVGPVEQVGFRSTKIRTLQGHLVTVPNSVVANSIVENIGRRPFIRRTSNITITYDSGHAKAARAVAIIKEVLADVPEVSSHSETMPRVYFSEFNDWSLNIYMSYWVRPADYWLYMQVNERVNLEIMKRFEAEEIEFAFPSQTLYVKKD